MTVTRSGRWLRTGATSLALCVVAILAPVTVSGVAAATRDCPSASVGGAAIGTVTVDDIAVPIKRTHLSSNGVLDAPPSARIAALVGDYLPLSALWGSSVIIWHSRFGAGCMGTLNVLFGKQRGDLLRITDAFGKVRTYKITARTVVPQGKYRAAWFRLEGPRQLTLITCTGFNGTRFRSNLVITAVPV